MTQSSFFTAAIVFVAVACADNPNAISGPTIGWPPIPPAPTNAMIAGRIIVSGEGADRVVDLRDDHGDLFRLLGNEVGVLTSVDGGDVIAFGTWDPNPGFAVREFQVVGMHGRPALDGVLEVSEEGFALRLADGTIHIVSGLPSECAEFLGARVWVIGWDENKDVQFGLIAAE